MRLISVVIAIIFFWTNCIWADYKLAPESLLADVMANARIAYTGIEGLRERGLKTLAFTERGGTAYYTFSPDGYFYRFTTQEKVTDPFYRLIERFITSRTERIKAGDYYQEVIQITPEIAGLVNACISKLYTEDEKGYISFRPMDLKSYSLAGLFEQADSRDGDKIFYDDGEIMIYWTQAQGDTIRVKEKGGEDLVLIIIDPFSKQLKDIYPKANLDQISLRLARIKDNPICDLIREALVLPDVDSELEKRVEKLGLLGEIYPTLTKANRISELMHSSIGGSSGVQQLAVADEEVAGLIDRLVTFRYYPHWHVRRLGLKAIERLSMIKSHLLSPGRLEEINGLFLQEDIRRDLASIKAILNTDLDFLRASFKLPELKIVDVDRLVVEYLDSGEEKSVYTADLYLIDGRRFRIALTPIRLSSNTMIFGELTLDSVTKAISRWDRLREVDPDIVPELRYWQYLGDIEKHVLPRSATGEVIDWDESLLLVARDFVEGMTLEEIMETNLPKEEVEQAVVEAIKTYLRTWMLTRDANGLGIFLGDPKPDNVILKRISKLMHSRADAYPHITEGGFGKGCLFDLEHLHEDVTLQQALGLLSYYYPKELINKALLELSPLYIWEQYFSTLKDTIDVRFIFHLGDSVRVFTIRLPKEPDEIADSFMFAYLYNLMISRGADSIGVYTEDEVFTPLHPESPSLQTGDEWQIKDSSLEKPRPLGRGVTGFTDRLISKLSRRFPPEEILDEAGKPGYSHIRPLLKKIYGKEVKFYKASHDEIEGIEHPNVNVITDTDLPLLRSLKNPKGLIAGVDAGGTDIKVVLYKDDKLVYVKGHNWDPGSFKEAEEHVSTVEILIKFCLIKMRLEEERDTDLIRDLVEVSDPRAGIERIRGFVSKVEDKYGRDFYSRLDAVGISWPEVFVSGRMVPFSDKVKGLSAEERVKIAGLRDEISNRFGQIPCAITNDGSMGSFWAGCELAKGNLMGISMGTSCGVGYVDREGRITDMLTEMAKVVLNLADDPTTIHDLTGVPGSVQKHLSQKGVFRIADKLGLDISEDKVRLFVARDYAKRYWIDVKGIDDSELIEHVYRRLDEKDREDYKRALISKGERLRYIQGLLDSSDEETRARTEEVFREIGRCLACFIGQIYFYFNESGTRDIVLSGRVIEGKAGEIIISTARQFLEERFPQLPGINIHPAAGITDNPDADRFSQAQGAVYLGYKKLIEERIFGIIRELRYRGIRARINNKDLGRIASSEQLLKHITDYTPFKNPIDIINILEARLEGRDIFLYNAVFNQKQFLKDLDRPINVAMFRGGRGVGELTRLMKGMPNVRISAVLAGTDDGRSWYHAAQDFDATGVPDCGKTLLDLARNVDVAGFLETRLKGEGAGLNKEVRGLIDNLKRGRAGIDLQKAQWIARYLSEFMDRLERDFPHSRFSLNNIPIRSLLLVGAAWCYKNNWQMAIDEVAELLDINPGDRIAFTTQERLHLAGLTKDGMIYFTETGITEYPKKEDFIGLWLFKKKPDIERIAELLREEGIDLNPVDIPRDMPGELALEVSETSRQIRQREKTGVCAAILSGLSDNEVGSAEINPVAEDIIQGADLIVYGPSSFESNVASGMLAGGIQELINGNRDALKILFVNPTVESEPGETTAWDMVAKLYRYITRQQPYRIGDVIWREGYIDYVVGRGLQYMPMDHRKRYIPFNSRDIREGTAGVVTPVGLRLEWDKPVLKERSDYGGYEEEYGFYSPQVMFENLIMLWALNRLGFKIEDGSLKRGSSQQAVGEIRINLVDSYIEEATSKEPPEWMAQDYRAGYLLMKDMPETGLDSKNEIIEDAMNNLYRATSDPIVRKRVERLLDILRNHPRIDNLTIIQYRGIAHRLVKEYSGNPNAYGDYKERLDRSFNEIYGAIRDEVSRITDDKERLRTAMLYAGIGNLMDLTYPDVLRRISDDLGIDVGDHLGLVKGVHKKIVSNGLIIEGDDFEKFLDNIKRTPDGLILYFLDNHGEVILDQLVIEELLKAGYKVAVVARGETARDDVTVSEARGIISSNNYLREYLESGRLSVMTDGSYLIGADLSQSEKHPEFLKAWQESISYIAKGAANFHTLLGQKLSIPGLHIRMMKGSSMSYKRLSELKGREISMRSDYDLAFVYQYAPLFNPKKLDGLVLPDGTRIKVYADKSDYPPEVLRHWDNHYAVFEITNEELGYTAYMAIHRLTRIISKCEKINGQWRATGGTRIRNYKSNEEALADALELAQEMSFKNAGALLAVGGSKCIINAEKREEILISYAKAIEEIGWRIGGGVLTGQDVNIAKEDTDLMAEYAPTSIVPNVAPDLSREPAPPTAVGVVAAIRAAVDIEGKVVAVQGAGGTGGRIIKQLLRLGAIVIASDISKDAINVLRSELTGEDRDRFYYIVEEKVGDKYTRDIMNPRAVRSFTDTLLHIYAIGEGQLDVFVPCAIGPVLNPESIVELQKAGVKVVCGSCNNVLEDKTRDARLLMEAGITFVPDYIANAGGVIGVDGHLGHDTSDEGIARRISDRVKDIIGQSKATEKTTQEIADTASREFFERLEIAKRIVQEDPSVYDLREEDIKGKAGIVRVGTDVLNNEGGIKSDTRIKILVPTIDSLFRRGARYLILCAYFGRPERGDKNKDQRYAGVLYDNLKSGRPIADRLQELTGRRVHFIPAVDKAGRFFEDYKDYLSYADAYIRANVRPGELVFLDNLRFWDEEDKRSAAGFSDFAERLAGLGSFYVQEGYPQAHRPNSTVVSIADKFKGKAVFGGSYLAEIRFFNRLRAKLDKRERGPINFILAGVKIETKPGVVSKITVVKKLLEKFRQGDYITLGGALAYTFIVAQYMIDNGIEAPDDVTDETIRDLVGNSMFQRELIQDALFILKKAKGKGVHVLLPVDHRTTDKLENGRLPEDADITVVKGNIPAGRSGVDIGPETEKIYIDALNSSETILMAGPLGIIEDERTVIGSLNLIKAMAKATERGAETIAAGGETEAVVSSAGVRLSHVSLGGGAALEDIEQDGNLPGTLAVRRNRPEKTGSIRTQGSHIVRRVEAGEEERLIYRMMLADIRAGPLREVLDRLKDIYGEGIFSQVKEIQVVENLGGGGVYPDGRAPLASFEGGVLKIDELAFRYGPDLLFEELEHEFLESIARLIPGATHALADVVSTFMNVKRFLESGPDEQERFLSFLRDDNPIDPDGEYLALLRRLSGIGDVTEDEIIASVVRYVMRTKLYEKARGELGLPEGLAGKIRDLEPRLDDVLAVFNEIARVGEGRELVDKVKRSGEQTIRMIERLRGIRVSVTEQSLLKERDILRERFLNGELTPEQFVRIVIDSLDRRRLILPGNIANPSDDYRYGHFFLKDLSEGDDYNTNLIVRRLKADLAYLARSVSDEGVRDRFTGAIKFFLSMPEIMEWTNFEVMEVNFEIIRIAAQCDPDLEEKGQMRLMAFSILDSALSLVKESKDPIESAIRIAVIGNTLDLAAIDLGEKIRGDKDYLARIFESEFRKEDFWTKNDIEEFRNKISDGPKDILYVFDNAGEDVFDFILINELLKLGHTVTLAGKSLPATNDTTAEELHKLLEDPRIRGILGENIHKIKVISSGTITLGTDLKRVSKDFQDAWESADVIIFKGQANYYTVRDYVPTRDCLFLLMVKRSSYVRDRYRNDSYVAEYLRGSPGMAFDEQSGIIEDIVNYTVQDYTFSKTNPPYIVGIAGGAGVGKTTFSGSLKDSLERKGMKVLVIGLDEFFKSPEDREGIGTEWDERHVRLEDIVSFMTDVKNGVKEIKRFKHVRKPRRELVEDVVNLEGVNIIIFEGLYTINNEDRLGNLLRFIDLPIFMHASIEDMKTWRFQQEAGKAVPRDEQGMIRHWEEGVLPDFKRNIMSQMANAKVIIYKDRDHNMRLEWKDGEAGPEGTRIIRTFNGIRIVGKVSDMARELIGYLARHEGLDLPESPDITRPRYIVVSKDRKKNRLEDVLRERYDIHVVTEIPKDAEFVVLVDPEDVGKWEGQGLLYLPLPYMEQSLKLAAGMLLSDQKIAQNYLKDFYNILLGRTLSDEEVSDLFHRPWWILPEIGGFVEELPILRDAISQLEESA